MTEPEKSWLACAIDGEGYITLVNKTDQRTGWRVRQVNVGVVNTDIRFVREVARLLGSKVTIHRHATSIRKTVYKSILTSPPKAAKVLSEVRRYFIIKKDKADAVILFASRTDWKRHSPEAKQRRSASMKTRWANGIRNLPQAQAKVPR